MLHLHADAACSALPVYQLSISATDRMTCTRQTDYCFFCFLCAAGCWQVAQCHASGNLPWTCGVSSTYRDLRVRKEKVSHFKATDLPSLIPKPESQISLSFLCFSRSLKESFDIQRQAQYKCKMKSPISLHNKVKRIDGHLK